jgi:NSS family neurotransmitter:Na+ symporter
VSSPPAARERWSSPAAFVLAATGAAAGLGNVWHFAAAAGRSGGGAFLLVHAAAVLLVGLPLLAAELLVGRGRACDPIDAYERRALRDGCARAWRLAGWLGAATALLVLALYAVVAGWAFAYLGFALRGVFGAASETSRVTALFPALLDSPAHLLLYHALFLIATGAIVSCGVRRGLEGAARLFVPAMVLLFAALAAWGTVTTGRGGEALAYLLRPDFAALGWRGAVAAVAAATFTLGIGMTSMVTYGAYLPRDVSIPRTAVAVALLDAAVALLAGMALLPVVFRSGLDATAGPGLVFVTFPVALAAIPGGWLYGAAFFAALLLTALTSAIAFLEPAVSTVVARTPLGRRAATALVVLPVWLLGTAAIGSFGAGSDGVFRGRGLFDLLNVATSSVLLPLGALLVALFVGWLLPSGATQESLGVAPRTHRAWRVLLRWVVPAAIVVGVVAEAWQ